MSLHIPIYNNFIARSRIEPGTHAVTGRALILSYQGQYPCTVQISPTTEISRLFYDISNSDKKSTTMHYASGGNPSVIKSYTVKDRCLIRSSLT